MDLDAFKNYFNQNDSFSAYNGIRLKSLEKGRAEAEMEIGPDTKNLMGTMHGGAYYTLADVAAGCAMIPYGRACVTLSADIHYLHPASAGTVTAEARVTQYGGRIGVAEVEIRNGAGELLCTVTVTMYLTQKPMEEIFPGRDGK